MNSAVDVSSAPNPLIRSLDHVQLPLPRLLRDLISRAAGDSRHTVEVELSPGASRIWLAARLGLADLHRAPAPLLARLLGENVRIGPHFFGYRAGDQHLLLHASIENRDMTPSRLETALERLSKLIRDTRPAWSALVRPEQGLADATNGEAANGERG